MVVVVVVVVVVYDILVSRGGARSADQQRMTMLRLAPVLVDTARLTATVAAAAAEEQPGEGPVLSSASSPSLATAGTECDCFDYRALVNADARNNTDGTSQC